MEERGDLHVNSLSDTSETENVSNIELYSSESEDSSDVESVGEQQLGHGQSRGRGRPHGSDRGRSMSLKLI
jgi:hypothetical protein